MIKIIRIDISSLTPKIIERLVEFLKGEGIIFEVWELEEL